MTDKPTPLRIPYVYDEQGVPHYEDEIENARRCPFEYGSEKKMCVHEGEMPKSSPLVGNIVFYAGFWWLILLVGIEKLIVRSSKKRAQGSRIGNAACENHGQHTGAAIHALSDLNDRRA